MLDTKFIHPFVTLTYIVNLELYYFHYSRLIPTTALIIYVLYINFGVQSSSHFPYICTSLSLIIVIYLHHINGQISFLSSFTLLLFYYYYCLPCIISLISSCIYTAE